MKDEKLKCNFCDNNRTSHIECIYGKIEIIKKHNDIFCFFSEDNKINSYIVCDNCFNKINIENQSLNCIYLLSEQIFILKKK